MFKDKLSLFLLFVLSVFLSSPCLATSFTVDNISENDNIFFWQEVATLPDDIGTTGLFVGAHNNAILVAGGISCPGKSCLHEDEKIYLDTIYVYSREGGGQTWNKVGQSTLPYSLAYGVTVSTDNGIILVGGRDDQQVYKQVLRLQWEPDSQSVNIEELPSLPIPLANMTGTIHDNIIYVAGGKSMVNADEFTNTFLALDLSAEQDTSQFKWVRLPEWPGVDRKSAISVIQNDGLYDTFYLFGGQKIQPDGSIEFLKDGYGFNLTSREWQRVDDISVNNINDPERMIPGGSTIKKGDSHVLVFGGSKNIFAYHTITDTWTKVGELPEDLKFPQVVEFGDNVIIPGGKSLSDAVSGKIWEGSIHPRTPAFGLVNYSVVGIYMFLLIMMGVYFYYKGVVDEDFFLAGKRIPWWAAGLSIYATQISAITFIAVPAVPYASNWLLIFTSITILLIVPFITTFYLPFFRRLNITTAYEYLELRFDLLVRLFGSLSFMIFQLARMSIIVFLPALALTAILGMNIYLAIILMGLFSTIYTYLGGMEAVIWSDVFQVIILMSGIFYCIGFVIIEVGGVDVVFNVAYEDSKLTLFNWNLSATELATWSIFLGSFALQFGPYTTDQAVIQRYLTTEDEKASANSIWTNGFISVPNGLLFFVLGTCLYAFYKFNPDLLSVGMQNDQIFPLFIGQQLPVGLAGLVIAGLFSASMSSLDSSMHSIATAYTIDFYKRFNPDSTESYRSKLAKIIVIIVGIIGTTMACILATFPIQYVYFLFQEVVGLLGSALAGIFMLGVFTRRANGMGALVGALFSLLAMGYAKFVVDVNFYVYPLIGIPVSVIIGYIVSLLSGSNKKDLSKLTYLDIRKNES